MSEETNEMEQVKEWPLPVLFAPNFLDALLQACGIENQRTRGKFRNVIVDFMKTACVSLGWSFDTVYARDFPWASITEGEYRKIKFCNSNMKFEQRVVYLKGVQAGQVFLKIIYTLELQRVPPVQQAQVLAEFRKRIVR